MKKRIVALMMAMVMVAGNGMISHASPERMEDGTLFDSDYYAETYPDLMCAFGRNTKKLYQHYKDYGKAEGRLGLSPDKYVYPELPVPALGDVYTADELITAYRTIIEANGIIWDRPLRVTGMKRLECMIYTNGTIMMIIIMEEAGEQVS